MAASCDIIDEGDRLVVVNRNPGRRNALSPEFYDGAGRAFALAAAEPRFGAVILTSADGFFCAGGDLNSLIRAGGLPAADRAARIHDFHRVIRGIRACPRPVIAAVEGGAAGAGMSIALACDLVVAAEDAAFTAAYVRAGLVPDGGLTAALTAALPPQLAAEICLLGKPIPAARLAAAGAINRLVAPGTALDTARDLASELAGGPAEAQAAIKRLIGGVRTALTEAQLDAEAEAMATALGGGEAAEGIAAFLGKRPPDFAALRRGG